MKRWKIKETSTFSLNELNEYIENNNIQPENLIQYRTVFEQMKQCIKYIITYWEEIKD